MSAPLQYSPFDPAIFDDPYPVYARLRAESPVHYVEDFDCWALSTFEDVWNACQSPDLYTAEKGTTAGHVLQNVVEVFPALDMMDPPRHTEHRALVSQRFLPGFVKRFEPTLRKIVRDRLEIARGQGRIDVVKELGSHLSTGAVCRILDFPEADRPEDCDQLLERPLSGPRKAPNHFYRDLETCEAYPGSH